MVWIYRKEQVFIYLKKICIVNFDKNCHFYFTCGD